MPSSQRFAYIAIRNRDGEPILRPMLPFRLVHDTRSQEVAGLLDSGADVNVLPYQVGIDLGAIWDHQTVIVQLSGKPGAL